ncbi:putative inactive 1-aminocyclopropane-1-carboxylate synthase-like protein 2 [Daldinia childiae]|uniref:putative inactive 1-aminocyclopropane-1-carboxylate synthase-like protein 2 n=1 Tax=Daldinia childiae TaxID=326645 RepID=UPI0014474E6B|nr:putative inactive 1-aminocyclopropane-1-carboxylate synthase-like protein 2 [Daldinia childiae]KAF3058033.1 putative inactive 1-aminocyclopropane-1-carboxylate synthase-like protein 2 [Daldinia childiae]
MLSIQHSRLSQRGLANVEKIWPRISSAVAERENNSNPVIDLGTSENWLIRNELLQIYKRAVAGNFSDRHLSYPDGFAGDVELLKALASFFNSYFKPHVPVEVEHIATAPGAAFALDALLYNICEPGDAVLVPGPFWNGFDWLLNVKASVQPVLVNVDTFENVFTTQLIPSLEKAFSESTYPIKGLLFTNPHNPFGRCYPESVIKECIKFCNAKNIHFISDELYALSAFESQDQPTPEPFVSVLQLDIEALGCDQSRVHTIWSTSKDFGSSGLRMVSSAFSMRLGSY